jgi:hypothetical protein
MSDSEHVGERREGYLELFACLDTEAALVDVASASAVSTHARAVKGGVGSRMGGTSDVAIGLGDVGIRKCEERGFYLV